MWVIVSRVLRENRDQWREQAQRLTQELAEVQATERKLRAEVDRLQAKAPSAAPGSGDLTEFALMPQRHPYSVGHTALVIALVLSDAASLRCAGRAIARLRTSLRLPCDAPAWATGRLWSLRLGYYQLMRPKERAAHWVWIVDHTVQIGDEKCLVILGLRRRALPAVGQCLRHTAGEPLALLPVEKSNGDVVYAQLEAQAQQLGPPRAIVGDRGTDLKAGGE